MRAKAKEVNENGELTHFSVGAIIKNDKGEYLLIDRLKQPFGFACPAGHVDENEDSVIAIIREVQEETGLNIQSIKKINIDDWKDMPNEACSHGVNKHTWELYNITASGELVFKEDEVKSIGWYSVEQIKELVLESIWKYWFEKLNII